MSATQTASVPGNDASRAGSNPLKRINLRQYGIMLALVVIVLLFQVLTDGKLLLPNNVASLMQQNAYVIVLALGMLMIIIAGHIDLSVGSVVAFLGGVMGIAMMHWHLPWGVAVLIGVLLGLVVGAWQGFWVAYVGIPGFIVTLASMMLFRGLAIVLVGETIAGLPSGFVRISNGGVLGIFGYMGVLDVFTLTLGAVLIVGFVVSEVRRRRSLVKNELRVEPGGLFLGRLIVISLVIGAFVFILAQSAIGTPFVLIICGILVLVYNFVMSRTVFGRHIYAVGGNIASARLSGISIRATHFLMYLNMGFLTAVAAVITTSRSGASVAAAGQNYEMDAIASCFIGGAAVSGGIGRVSGTIIGALIMGVLNMGLSILAVDAAWQQSIKGLVLLLAVAFDLVNKRRGNR
ncbi:sugar ABC transporter permease [Brooklawnia cerclae]|uniref:Xylose transport system permease protein XylH n=1 Tax=Brooklawnia cerclae TaxID=349934 RepID=A0ABX0SK01_9ACTN|nr:multiple monosaccharide ABC transporter permease [Brooklawnia cerclae]NIH58729.1 putative multiple sugar transport system permease protein [Brooklawnia cerclae]